MHISSPMYNLQYKSATVRKFEKDMHKVDLLWLSGSSYDFLCSYLAQQQRVLFQSYVVSIGVHFGSSAFCFIYKLALVPALCAGIADYDKSNVSVISASIRT